jgi:ribosome-associated protein
VSILTASNTQPDSNSQVSLQKFPVEARSALEAAQSKQALNITLLDLGGLGAFADCFLLCSAASGPQMEAIGDEVERQLELHHRRVLHREGRAGSEWMLLDYGGLVVHIFTERARLFYDLERLWRDARRLDVPESAAPVAPAAVSEGGGCRE